MRRALEQVAAVVLSVCAVAATCGGLHAAMSSAQRDILSRYLDALQHERYAAAFALLSAPERRYFGTPRNFASVYAADRLKIASFKLLASTTLPQRGTVAIVSERITFFDPAHQTPASATARVAYGILPAAGGLSIKDPYHPWRAIAPEGLSLTANGMRVLVRKISFFTGRVEIVATFQNLGDTVVTLLPYGRSIIRDEAGKAYRPIATKLPGLTDRALFGGLRLPGSGQYTGLMTFFTPDRFTPASLAITFAPNLADGADAPFVLELPSYKLPT